MNTLGRFGLLGLVVCALILAMFGVFVRVPKESLRWARVYGGPTTLLGPSVLGVEVLEPNGVLANQDIDVTLGFSDGTTQQQRCLTDDEGSTYVPIEVTRKTVSHVRVRSGDTLLADAAVQVSSEAYRAASCFEGGVFSKRTLGTTQVEVGLLEGLGVPGLPFTLLLQIDDDALVERRIELVAEGMRFGELGQSVAVTTKGSGTTPLSVTLIDLVAMLELGMGDERWSSEVPLRGGLKATFDGANVVLESPVERRRAYLAQVTASGWRTARSVELSRTDRGVWAGKAVLPKVSEEAWLMVGTEPMLRGKNVIGWAIADKDEALSPRRTRIMPAQLWTDGRGLAVTRAEKEQSRARWCAISLAGGLGLVLLHSLLFGVVRDRGTTNSGKYAWFVPLVLLAAGVGLLLLWVLLFARALP